MGVGVNTDDLDKSDFGLNERFLKEAGLKTDGLVRRHAVDLAGEEIGPRTGGREICDDARTDEFSFVTSRTIGKIQTVQVPLGSKVSIYSSAVITDNDDTLLQGTGEGFHDGHTACFAIALSTVIVAQNEIMNSGKITKEDMERFYESGSIFTTEDWKPFKACTGKSEPDVLTGLLDVARDRYGLHNFTRIDLLADRVKHVRESYWDKLMQNVRLDNGLVRFFNDVKALGAPLGVCSASGDEFVHKALSCHGVKDLFEAMICGAVKKKSDHSYCGLDLIKVCDRLKVSPSSAVMLGDSMSDIGAGLQAGMLVVIRLPEYFMKDEMGDLSTVTELIARRLDIVSRSIDTFSFNYIERPFFNPTVVFVENFDQLEFGGVLGSSENSKFDILLN